MFNMSCKMPAIGRIENNDRILTHLHMLVREHSAWFKIEGPHSDVEYITNDDQVLKRICDGIGNNTHLKKLCFDVPLGLADTIATLPSFEGLRHNTSIDSLELSRCHLSGQGVGHEVMKAFEENNQHLVKIALCSCSILNEGTHALAATLLRCTQLEEISLQSCQIDDGMVEDLVSAIRVRGQHYPHLECLDLKDNNIRSAGCEALATLLQDTNNCCRNLQILDLSNNSIDDVGTAALATGLTNNNNSKLESVFLDDNDDISSAGWDYFSKAMCNPSNINATYFSNHTLRQVEISGSGSSDRLYDEDRFLSSYLILMSCIELNDSSRDKKVVAREKILLQHFNSDDDFPMEPFFTERDNMDLNVMPHVLSWIGKLPDSTSSATMFTLLKRMPTLCAVPLLPKVLKVKDEEQRDGSTEPGQPNRHR